MKNNDIRPQKDTGPRINNHITAKRVRLIDAAGTNAGIVPLRRAQSIAYEAGLDLVEISPNAHPPVVKVIDYGKYRYEMQKKAAETRKKQKTIDIKEIKFRPNTDANDFNIKMRNVHKFLGQGNKVKITLRFRGREMAHQQLGMQIMERVLTEVEGVAKADNKPSMEGRQATMMLSPLTDKK